eukprot:4834328-Pleurochrysis_carterae.AAC.2
MPEKVAEQSIYSALRSNLFSQEGCSSWTTLRMLNKLTTLMAPQSRLSSEHYKRWEYYLRECQLNGLIKAHFAQ